MKTRSSPNELFASDLARSKPSRSSALVPGDAHALAAAAGRSLDHHGIADLGSDLLGMVGVLDDAEKARNGADPGGIGEFLGFDLVAHRLDRLRLGADEDDALCFQRRAEGGPLGEEPVAGMDGFGAGRLAGRDDIFGDEIALRGRRRADMHRLVGHLDMHGVAVGIGIDGDRRDPHLPRRPDDAAGDLAAIGDQDFLEHRRAFFLRCVFFMGLDGASQAPMPCRPRGRLPARFLPVDRHRRSCETLARKSHIWRSLA